MYLVSRGCCPRHGGWSAALPDGAGRVDRVDSTVPVVAHEGPGRRRHEHHSHQAGRQSRATSPRTTTDRTDQWTGRQNLGGKGRYMELSVHIGWLHDSRGLIICIVLVQNYLFEDLLDFSGKN